MMMMMIMMMIMIFSKVTPELKDWILSVTNGAAQVMIMMMILMMMMIMMIRLPTLPQPLVAPRFRMNVSEGLSSHAFKYLDWIY